MFIIGKLLILNFFQVTLQKTKRYENCKFGFLNLSQYKNMDSFELLIRYTTSQEAFQFFLKVELIKKNYHIYWITQFDKQQKKII